MIEAWRNAVGMGAFALCAAVIANSRSGRPWLPVVAFAGAGLAVYLEVLSPAWVFDSLLTDAPWKPALLLALWSAHASSAWLRTRSWWVVVLAAALLGDRFVALGLAVAEPDPARRARLVIAASGASLIGPWSGAAPLVLGHAGVEAAVVGCVLMSLGFVRGAPDGIRTVVPSLRAILAGAVVPLFGALVVWLAVAGGALEFVATGLEQVTLQWLPRADLFVFSCATLASAVGDEGVFGLIVQQVELRALSLRGEAIPLALRAGLAVGGGLPLLVLTGARLRVGLPLWFAQIGVVTLWLYLR